ncbi:MAG: hypothetical protein ABIT37_04255 [Luteolibacter sp.]
MNLRFIGYNGPVPETSKGLAELMSQRRYTKKAKSGFYLESSSSSELRGRFIRRVERNRKIEDPVAGDASFTEIYFESTRFIFYLDSKTICLVDSPRSSRFFTGALEATFGRGFILESLHLDVATAVDFFSTSFKITVRQVDIRNSVIAAGVEATIIARGVKGVMDAINKLNSRKGGNIAKVKLEILSDSKPHCLIIHKGMRFIFDDGSQEFLVSQIVEIVSKTR